MAKKKAGPGSGPGGKSPKRKPKGAGGSGKASGGRRAAAPPFQMIEALMRQALGAMEPADDDSPAGRARALVEEAYDAEGPREQAELARRALGIDPDCVDAHAMLGDLSRNPQEAIGHYEAALAAGERALGAGAFERDAGQFWGLLETRPYMRARLSLAQALWALGRRDEAIGHHLELLRLNPNDNQGVRYLLTPALIEQGRDDEARAVLARYPDDGSAAFAFDAALLAFRREGEGPGSKKALTAAKKVNKHVPAYLTGAKVIPVHLPEAIGFGDESEAIDYAAAHLRAWKDTPGALDWLRGSAGKRKAKAPAARGPLPLVKARMMRAPRIDGTAWEADARALPIRFEEPGQAGEPWLTLVVSLADGLMLGQKISDGPPAPEALWDLLARAVEAPAAGDPHRPATLRVRPGSGWGELAGHCREVGIDCVETGGFELIDDLFADLLDHLGIGAEPPGLLDEPGMTPARVGSFFTAAAEFHRRAPWKSVAGDETIEVRCDRLGKAPRYACVMGQMGMTRGVALYDDLAALTSIRSDDLPDEQIAEMTVALSLTYGTERETPPADVLAAREHGWEVAGPDAYPSAFRKEFGPVMRPPHPDELEFLEATLRALPEFLHRRDDRARTKEQVRVSTASGQTTVTLRWVE